MRVFDSVAMRLVSDDPYVANGADCLRPFKLGTVSADAQQPGSDRRRRGFSTLASILLMAATAPVFAQGIVAFDFLEKRITSAQATAPLTDEVFGDSVSLYDGSTRFEVFDIDLPGNNHLPVRLGRTWKPVMVPNYVNASGSSDQVTPLGGFGEWDISVPHISGTFDLAYGWYDTSHKRQCSTIQMAQTTQGINPRDILSGRQLYIPGEGAVDLMWIGSGLPGQLGVEYVRPTDGAIYYWKTTSNYRGRCVSLGSGQGEGFEFVDPQGTVYRFDKRATRDGGVVAKSHLQGYTVQASRVVIYLLATKVTDRHGNWVEYHYVGNGELDKIVSSDGRQITVTRQSGRITSATAGTRTWNYQYAPNFEVINPDQTRWKYESSGALITNFLNNVHDDPANCHYPVINGSVGDYSLIVTAPSGLRGTFTFTPAVHMLSWDARTGVLPSGADSGASGIAAADDREHRHAGLLREYRTRSQGAVGTRYGPQSVDVLVWQPRDRQGLLRYHLVPVL